MATSVSRSLVVITPDDDQWDGFVQEHPQGHLLQMTAWGKLKSAFGWQTARIAIADGSVLRAGAQILIRRKFGFAAAYLPRGPLFSGDEAVDDLLLAQIKRFVRRQRAVFLRIEPNVHEDAAAADTLHTFLLLRGWEPTDPLQPRSTVQLDLVTPLDAIFMRMSKGHRADIRRAERQGVTIRVGTTLADLAAFFTAMEATSSRKSDYALHSAAYYRRAWEVFAAEDRVLLLLAEADNEVVGTCMVFAGAYQGLYLYGGSNELGLKKGANHLLQWHALQWVQAQGCRSYDFWGIPDAFGQAARVTDTAERDRLEAVARDDPLYGVYRFKKGFGGTVVRFLPAYDHVYLRLLYAFWRRQGG